MKKLLRPPLAIPRPSKSKDTSAAKSQSSCLLRRGLPGNAEEPWRQNIEGDLEEALFHSGAVPEQDRGNPKRYDWARSARTDKGVSAVGQVVSGRFYIDPPGLVERLNSNLASQIRIFGYKRVTASFNAKKFCDRRRYVYLIPVFALDPCSHPDRESVLASLGSDNELVKCLECSERGRKVVGAVGKRSFELKSVVSQTDISSNGDDRVVKPEIMDDISMSTDNADCDNTNAEFLKEAKVPGNVDAETRCAIPESGILSNDLDAKTEPDSREEIMESVDNNNNGNTETEIIEKDQKAEDPSARRYIISFDAKTSVTVEGIEFVKCEVVGQSFMLHQIRKMIGLAVAVVRNCAPESLISTALQKDVNINVPTAPEVGLYLDECLFASYNQKWKDSHEEISMKDYEEMAEDFKMKHIYSHIASTEHKEGAVALWLHSLNHRNYPDLRVSNYGDTNDDLLIDKQIQFGTQIERDMDFFGAQGFNYSDIGREYALQNSSGDRYTRSLRQMRDWFIKKVVLSSSPLKASNFVAMTILNQTGDLAYCRNGNQSWTIIENARSFCEDVVCFNGFFYAVNKSGQIAICDVTSDSPEVSFIETPRQAGGDMQYLVSSADELLLVTRYLDLEFEVDHPDRQQYIMYRTIRFEVFRLDWSGPRWVRVRSLGDKVLFIGENTSLSLSATDFSGCMGNCIYYTDDYSDTNYDGHFGEHDLGIFKLLDGSIEPLPCYPRNFHSRLRWPPPLWVSPNPC
ncbi:hypothetical protein GH714_007006 [Hevea brasiliensis]|uniref:Pseudouridine synthase I TruA alpha/beta domain-containing protein n=1 Tax=Hevea brasiliensis TaxID=3981 RepID=A0A6A6MA72_HEVBR|nr:hypothetical protein GH714_007006 [Hevea brasiliensis]